MLPTNCLLFPFSHSILYLGCSSLPAVAVSFLARCLDWPYVHHLHKHCNNINYFITQTFNQATINSQRRGLISGEKIIKNSTCCAMKPHLHPTIIKNPTDNSASQFFRWLLQNMYMQDVLHFYLFFKCRNMQKWRPTVPTYSK